MKRNHIKQRISDKPYTFKMEVAKENYSMVKTAMCQYITTKAMEGHVKAKDILTLCVHVHISISRHVAGQQLHGLGILTLCKYIGDFSCFQFHYRTAIGSNKCFQSCYMQSAIFLFLLTNP